MLKIKSKYTFYVKEFFFSKILPLWDNVGKYCRAGRATDDDMAHAHCMLDTSYYKSTPRICNNHCLSTAKAVARKRVNVTLYLNCQSQYLKIPVTISQFRCVSTTLLRSTSSPPNHETHRSLLISNSSKFPHSCYQPRHPALLVPGRAFYRYKWSAPHPGHFTSGIRVPDNPSFNRRLAYPQS
jgi:hypothetical protein